MKCGWHCACSLFAVCLLVLAPVLVPMNVGDVPSRLPPLDDYLNTVPGNTNFPGLDNSSSTAGMHLLHTMEMDLWLCTAGLLSEDGGSLLMLVFRAFSV